MKGIPTEFREENFNSGKSGAPINMRDLHSQLSIAVGLGKKYEESCQNLLRNFIGGGAPGVFSKSVFVSQTWEDKAIGEIRKISIRDLNVGTMNSQLERTANIVSSMAELINVLERIANELIIQQKEAGGHTGAYYNVR